MSESPVQPLPMATYPLTIAPDHRHLTDQNGTPFLVVGDAAWSLLVSLTREEAIRYLDDRAARGFNTLMINLLEYRFAPDAPRNRYGEAPFSSAGDFSTPNAAYFAHARWVLERARERGIMVLLDPSNLGYRNAGWPGQTSWNEGWFGEVVANGFDRCRAYGRFVGARFGDLDNIVWVMGGDADPDIALICISQMAEGIRETDSRHLMTAHCRPETVPAAAYRGEPWFAVNNTYTYGIVHAKLYDDYVRVPTMPFFLIESTYEGEHTASEAQVRRQAYWSVLRGGCGHVFGCNPLWDFGSGWEAALDWPGSRGMMRFAEAFRGRRWWTLVPEPAVGVPWDPRSQSGRLLVSGLGESRGLDFCTAARSEDGTLAMAYMPTPRPLSLELGVLAGSRVRVSWYDPIRGGWREGGERAREAVMLEPPGAQDWLLALESVV